MYKLFFSFFAAFVLVSQTLALAPVQSPIDGLPSMEQAPTDTLASLIKYFVMLTSVLAIIAITWWGIQMIMAVGDDEKNKKARHTIIYAFIGLLVSLLAYATVSFVTRMNFNNFIL